ncbi:MAG: hypothetical protein CVU59_09790 [Deltaproteobacteria bacterium HGW-Deltaproteobacteria-17]|nr:MAG: hypothetical protein CVU59_09790 [Deltaproteobacteria bacterium HGW-Deltaproteobacteria-17]
MTPALAHSDLLRKLLTCGLPPHADTERLRLTVILNLSSLVGGLFLMIFAIHNLVDGDLGLGLGDAVTCGIILASNLHLRRSGNHRLVSWVIISASCLFFLFVLSRGEVQQATYVWSLSVPVITVSLLGPKTGLRLAALYWILLLAYFLSAHRFDGLTHYPRFIFVRALSVYGLITAMVLFMEKRRQRAFRELQDKRAELAGQIQRLKQEEEEKELLIQRHQRSLAEVKTLKGFLPICSYCKKIRDDAGYWNGLEQYLTAHTDARVEMGLCPDCTKDRQS